VLDKSGGILVPGIVTLRIRLVVIAANSKQKIRKVRTRLRTEERKRTVERRIRIDIDLFVAELQSRLHRIWPPAFGEAVVDDVCIVRLRQIGDRDAHDKGTEDDVLHAFD